MSKPWQRERSRIALLVLFGIGVGIALGEIVARSLWTAPWYERLIQEQRGERELGALPGVVVVIVGAGLNLIGDGLSQRLGQRQHALL